MTPLIIWGLAFTAYAVFWLWYVGLRSKVTPGEADEAFLALDGGSWTEAQRQNVRDFFASDDGKEFVMVNLLDLKKPVSTSLKQLTAYQKIFVGKLMRKAGHPIAIARTNIGNIENVACDNFDNWDVAALMRYRSRRDLLEMLHETVGSEHHGWKLAALEKTIAFPSTSWFILGGPRVVVALAIALLAALAHIVIG